MEEAIPDQSSVEISDAQVTRYREDGAVCLRGLFTPWLESLAEGVELNIAEPGPVATEHKLDDGAGRFFEDYCNWQRIPAYRDFVLQSPAAEIAARFMGGRQVRIFHEHVLVKEPGTTKATPWHHDMPYYYVQGDQVISFWLALDPVSKATCPEFIAGSHRWGKLYYPRLFYDGSDYDYRGEGYETVPDIDAQRDRYRILSWDLEPGDVLLFHYLTLHAAPGNTGVHRRRGFSTRWLGEDVCFAARPGTTSPPCPVLGLKDGDPLPETLCPVVWQDGRLRAL